MAWSLHGRLCEEALKKEFFSWDDVQNLYRPFDGKLLSPNICGNCGETAVCLDSETGECQDCYEENRDTQEIYEWWVVSGWLEIMLRKHGEPILSNNYGNWWGRCATGQAVFMDGVIRDIFDEVMNE